MNGSNRNPWVDYLRSAITVMVVAHHSMLSYTTFAWFDKKAYILSSHPIVDTKRWIGLDILVNFNDIFFMSLMFLIGGLFLTRSLNRKGRRDFTKDRLYRLFIPFLFLGTLFMLLAYFPAYFVAYNSTDIIAYIVDFFTTEMWPVGPPWFLWVLFLFNLAFVLIYPLLRKLGAKTAMHFSALGNKPFSFFMVVYIITWILYVPVAYHVGAGTWTGIGPFDFQLSRILLYFGYFTLGILIGNTDFSNAIFATTSAIVKKWRLWIVLALAVFTGLTVLSGLLTQLVKDGKINEPLGWMIYYAVYAASCVLSCIAFITTFRHWVRTGKQWLNSFSENAYLVYLIHYIFVVWCQFLLLKLNIPAFTKFLVTFMLALPLSWMASILLRRIKIVEKYL